MSSILLGTQDWEHRSWVGSFYPPGIAPSEMLEFYSARLPTVEVGRTFYCVPPPAVIADWRQRARDGFRFSLKVPQQVTHERRLQEAGDLLRQFCDRVAALGSRLGAFLVQLSPDFESEARNRAILVEFLAALPAGFRWAIEFRHRAWLKPELLTLLERQGAALALTDSRWLPPEEVLNLALRPTADFSYLRLGWRESSAAGQHALYLWARVIEVLSAKVEVVYGYFRDGASGSGVVAVRELERLLGVNRSGT